MQHRKLKSAYKAHKNGARQRGIQFLLTFEKWSQIWKDSGHLHERGCRKGQYVMARFGDEGPYIKGNVKIIQVERNRAEQVLTDETRLRRSKALRGNSNKLGFKCTELTRLKMSKPKAFSAIENMIKAQRARRLRERILEA